VTDDVTNDVTGKPLIAVSRCLLGERVRYDGDVKSYPKLLDFIQQNFSIVCVCPEVEIGLGVPRPAVQLYGKINAIRICGRDDPSIDITDAMQKYCDKRPPQLNSIQGYIFKSKSPSCGIKDIPLFNLKGEITQTTKGTFVSAVLKHYPHLPITDEQSLQSDAQYEQFLQQVKHYQHK